MTNQRPYWSLGPKTSDFTIGIFLVLTLFLRFQIESSLQGFWMISLFIGVLPLLLIYSLIRNKILNPGFFGLYKRA